MTDPENPTPAHDGERPEEGRSSAPSLPPPAFPPGSRHEARRRAEASLVADVEEALIAYDEPIPPRNELEDALISPDDPMPHRAQGERDEAVPAAGAPGQGLVVGMGNDAHLAPEELVAHGDPHLMALTEKVGKLAQALRQRGEAGLHSDADMDRFDATLRAYCVGYLAGRRAEEG